VPTSTSWSEAAAPPSAESRTDTSERHRFTQDVGLDVCAQTRRRNDINGSAEYVLNLALQSGDVEKAHCPIEIDEQVDVGFLGVRSFRDTAEDTGVAPSVGSNQAKDELTILGERSAAGCSAVKAQQAGYLRLTASDPKKAADSSAMRRVRRRYTCSIFGTFRVTSSKGWCIQRLWPNGERERARMGHPFGASPRVLPSSSLY
jgi:hypothetical protein